MADDYTDETDKNPGVSSDRSLGEGASDPTDQGSQPQRDIQSSLDTDRDRASERDGRLQSNDPLEAEIVEEVQARVTQEMMAVISHSGPLPPSAEFGGYENILPGSADRILSMAELSANAAAEATLADAAATRAAAESVLEDGRAVKRGQNIFGILAALCIICATVLILFGHAVPAGLLGILGLASGVGALIKPVNKDRWRPEIGRGSQQE